MTDGILLTNRDILLFVAAPDGGCQPIKICGLAKDARIASYIKDGAIVVDLDPGGVNSQSRREFDQEYESARVAEKNRAIDDALAENSARYHSILMAKDGAIADLKMAVDHLKKKRRRTVKPKAAASKKRGRK